MIVKHRHTWSLGALLAASLLMIGCPEGELPSQQAEPNGTEDEIVLDAELDSGSVLDSLLAYPCDRVVAPADNEQHDCQRLAAIRDERFQFGPLAGIYPDTLMLMRPDSFFLDTARAIAHATNAGALIAGMAGGYLALGIQEASFAATEYRTDVYCLWLQWIGGSNWRAALTPIPNREAIRDCGPEPREWNLDVRRQTYGSAPLGAYPNTVRWQWTTPADTTGEHYIGVKCGAGWCSVGRAGFAPQLLPTVASQPDTLRAIPGFHDAQFLAVRGPGGTLRPGPWATVYHSDSGSSGSQGFRRAAIFEVSQAPGPYGAKLGLSRDPQTGLWRSDLWLLSTPTEGIAYYVNPAGGASLARAVRKGSRPHGAHRSSRFRWHDSDETTWVPCQGWGCCDVEEGG